MGRYKDPDSRRSRAELARIARLAATEIPEPTPIQGKPALVAGTGSAVPVCPEWLSPSQAATFRNIVSDLQVAKVPLKRIDAHAIMMVVQCLDGVREASLLGENPEAGTADRLAALRLKQQLGKDLIQWLPLIGACPIGRQRLGQKPEPEKRQGALAELLARRQSRGA